MRPIDADYVRGALVAELWRENDDLEDRQWAYGYAAGVYFAIRKLAETPTLTPPNEPLTLEHLRASPHGKIKDSTLQSICNRANEIACRPPEGET